MVTALSWIAYQWRGLYLNRKKKKRSYLIRKYPARVPSIGIGVWKNPGKVFLFFIFTSLLLRTQALLVQARWNIANVLHDVARIPSDLQHGVLASPAAPPPEHFLPPRLQPEEALQALQLEVRRAQCHPHLRDLALSLGLLHWWVTIGAASESLPDHPTWGD